MNADPSDSFFGDARQWQDARMLRGLLRFAPVVPIGTLMGCTVVFACLSPVTSRALLVGWLNAGLFLVALQWLGWQIVHRKPLQSASLDETRTYRRWFVASALSTGVYWGATSIVLFPDGSPTHQIFLAFVLAAVTALWMPLFALQRLTVAALAAPALLPMASKLLSSPSAPQTTMGSLLLLLFAALVIIAHVVKRALDDDCATQQALYHRATHDSLVELANHAEFHRRVHALGSAPSGPYAIVFIDLDHFKDVNDSAGHAAGDRVLQEVGAIVRQEIRKADTGARVGGDEFAVLMQLCTDQEALRVARAILRRMKQLPPTSGTDSRVTASIGIACSSGPGMSARSVLEAADEACYAAKKSGRNRIEIARTTEVQCDRSASSVSIPGQIVKLAHGSRSKDAPGSTGKPLLKGPDEWELRRDTGGRHAC